MKYILLIFSLLLSSCNKDTRSDKVKAADLVTYRTLDAIEKKYKFPKHFDKATREKIKSTGYW